MRVLSQQFADRHDHGGSAREGSASGRAHCAGATAEDRGVPQENRERALENAGIPGGIDTVSYILLGMAAEKYPSDPITDAWARYVKNNQSPDGRWQCGSMRPPLESSDFQVTAASIRSVRTYGPKSQRAEYDNAVARAVRWLEKARPTSTEDHAFKILGLIWGGGTNAAIQKTARELLALQRSDGGWGQLSSLASDAYATGQALVALRESRAVALTQSGVPARHSVSARLSARRRIVVRPHACAADPTVFRQRLPARAGPVHIRGGDQLGCDGVDDRRAVKGARRH